VRRDLVTGGAGFIGSHLVDGLIAAGDDVVVLDDFSAGNIDNLTAARASGRLRIVDGSVLDPAAVDAAIGGCTHVFHMAIQCVRRSLGRPLENHEVNATGTLRLLEAARRHSVRRFLYCSSSEVYGNASAGALDEAAAPCAPTTVYGAAKLAGELYALAYWRTYGLPVAIVRPFNAFGPREHVAGDLAEVIPRFVARALNGEPPVIFGDGNQGRDFTFVADTARGLRAAMACDALVGHAVNLGHGRAITVREVAAAVLRLCGRNDLTVRFAAGRPGDVHTLCAGTQRAREWLGFVPQVSFEDGLARYLAWFRAKYPDPGVLRDDPVVNWQMPPG